MNFELRQAQRRFEEEQQRAKERARRKAERERKVKEEADARKAAEEEAHKRQRQEEAARAAEAQRQLEADLEKGGGIALRRVLHVVRVPGTGDRITLPPSMLQDLPLDQALDRGPMLFEISASVPASGAQGGSAGAPAPSRESAGRGRAQENWHGHGEGVGDEEEEENGSRATHAGVSEFTAPEGCVGLPDHVLRNLMLKLGTLRAPLDPLESTTVPLTNVRVRYVRLPKGRQVQLQPVGASAGAFGELVADQKAALEGHLRGFATLTDGDVLVMPLGAHQFALRVTHLKPEGKVSVIDTDLEVDLVLPPPAQSPARAPPGKGTGTGAGAGAGAGTAGGRGFGNRVRLGSAGRGAKGTPAVRPAAPGNAPVPGAAGDQLVTVLAPGQEMSVRVGVGEWKFFKLAGRHSPPPPPGGPSSASDPGSTSQDSAQSAAQDVAQDVLVSVHWERPRGLPAWRSHMSQGNSGAVSQARRAGQGQDMDIEGGAGGVSASSSVGGGEDGGALEVDLYASVPPVVYPSLLDHAVCALSLGPKQLRIPAALLGPASAGPGRCVVGAHAVQGAGEFVIQAELVPPLVEPQTGVGKEGAAHVDAQKGAQQEIQGEAGKQAQQGAEAGVNGGPNGVPGRGGMGLGGSVDDGLVECGNCRTRVAPHRLPLHEAFCLRNNARCPVPSCQAVLLKADLARGTHRHCPVCQDLISHGYAPQEPAASTGAGGSSGARGSSGAGVGGSQEGEEAALVEAALQKHMESLHSERPCECGALMETKDLAKHRRSECPQRWILCPFCGLSVQAGGAPPMARDAARGLTAHEASCGSRTAPCDTCGAPVVLKDMDLHNAAFHAASDVARQLLASLHSRPQPPPHILTGHDSRAQPASQALSGLEDFGSGSASTSGSGSGGLGPSQAGAGSTLSHRGGAPGVPQLPVVGGSDLVGPPPAFDFPMEEDDFTGAGAPGVPAQSSLNVTCPLCGEKVHSERHLSQHIDAVH